MQSKRGGLPAGFDKFTEDLLTEMESVEGYLAPNEIRFLALLAAFPTADGEILEIGSFKGKSTIILAKAAALADNSRVNAVDPMTAPCETDPTLGDQTSSYPDFQRNIDTANVADRVRLHRMLSSELAPSWNTPLRFLWIDGDHTYAGTKLDFDGFAPHLVDRSIVAIHDTLHEFEGGARVYLESILRSPNFGACGFCGSIAWAQYHEVPANAARHESKKRDLAKRVEGLLPYLGKGELRGLKKKMYKIARWRVPHGAVDPREWMASVD